MSLVLSRPGAAQSAEQLLGALAAAIVAVDAALRQQPRDEQRVELLDRRVADLRVALAARDYPASS